MRALTSLTRSGGPAGSAARGAARPMSTPKSKPSSSIGHRLLPSTSTTNTLIIARSSSSSSQPATPATDAEEEANKKRWQESGGGVGSSDSWRWTLNWDEVISPSPSNNGGRVFVGSCPRSASDVDEIVKGTGATAILCLQSDLCLEALKIDWQGVTSRADELGIIHTRAAVRDFDHGDQAFMLPEAVRLLAALLELGETVYVHCTAGINRATLTVVGFLTFFKGQDLERALKKVKARRPQANPYVDCWKSVRARALEGRGEEVAARAKARYLRRSACESLSSGGSFSTTSPSDSSTMSTSATLDEEECDVLLSSVDNDDEGEGRGLRDWVAAESDLLKEATGRQVECTMTLARSLKKRAAKEIAAVEQKAAERERVVAEELEEARRELEAVKEQAAMLAAALDGGSGGGNGNGSTSLRSAAAGGNGSFFSASSSASSAQKKQQGSGSLALAQALAEARAEADALRAAAEEVVAVASAAVAEEEEEEEERCLER